MAGIEEAKRDLARIIGLALAMIVIILMLFILLKLASLTQPIVLNLSIRDLILMAGGLFLLWKAVMEIHHTIELDEQHSEKTSGVAAGMAAVISQIVLLDIVFSVDSVITAIGLTDKYG